MTRACAALTFVVALSTSARTRADAIDGPPSGCPTGSVGTSSHSGSWCEAYDCATDADCRGVGRMGAAQRTYTCEAVDLCVRTESYRLNSRLALPPGQAPPTGTRNVGEGPCGSTCIAPATCSHAKRCVESTVSSIRNVGGCSSCAATATPRDHTPIAGVAFTVAALALAIALTRRSR